MICTKCNSEMFHEDSHYDCEWNGEEYEEYYIPALYYCYTCSKTIYECDDEYKSPED